MMWKSKLSELQLRAHGDGQNKNTDTRARQPEALPSPMRMKKKKRVQSLWRTVWKVLKKANPPLAIWYIRSTPRRMSQKNKNPGPRKAVCARRHRGTSSRQLCLYSLRTGNVPTVLHRMNGQTNWSIHPMDYRWAIRRNKLYIYTHSQLGWSSRPLC